MAFPPKDVAAQEATQQKVILPLLSSYARLLRPTPPHTATHPIGAWLSSVPPPPPPPPPPQGPPPPAPGGAGARPLARPPPRIPGAYGVAQRGGGGGSALPLDALPAALSGLHVWSDEVAAGGSRTKGLQVWLLPCQQHLAGKGVAANVPPTG